LSQTRSKASMLNPIFNMDMFAVSIVRNIEKSSCLDWDSNHRS
jgi:hypothetical protein